MQNSAEKFGVKVFQKAEQKTKKEMSLDKKIRGLDQNMQHLDSTKSET